MLPFVISLKRGELWHKVAIYSILIREFNINEGLLDFELVLNEIRTFNKGLEPIGKSYWATTRSTRESGLKRIGTIIIAFPTEDQANRAIKNRLYIAGISAKVAKFIAISSTAQCKKCAGFGHSDLFCKKEPKCILCAENHITSTHFCTTCKKTNTKCNHLSIKCVNCKSITHSADSKLCEVYLAIKNKDTYSKHTPNIPINEN